MSEQAQLQCQTLRHSGIYASSHLPVKEDRLSVLTEELSSHLQAKGASAGLRALHGWRRRRLQTKTEGKAAEAERCMKGRGKNRLLTARSPAPSAVAGGGSRSTLWCSHSAKASLLPPFTFTSIS